MRVHVDQKQTGRWTYLPGCFKDAAGLLQDPSTKGGKEKQAKIKQSDLLSEASFVAYLRCIEVQNFRATEVSAGYLPSWIFTRLFVFCRFMSKSASFLPMKANTQGGLDGKSSLAEFILKATTTPNHFLSEYLHMRTRVASPRGSWASAVGKAFQSSSHLVLLQPEPQAHNPPSMPTRLPWQNGGAASGSALRDRAPVGLPGAAPGGTSGGRLIPAPRIQPRVYVGKLRSASGRVQKGHTAPAGFFFESQ